MRAWRLHELGEPADVLVWEDAPDPEPGPGEVVIKVAAAGLNFPDLLRCRGEYQVKPPMPFVPGAEAAGTVLAVGDGVHGLEPGTRVAVAQMLGALGERMLAESIRVHPIPVGLDFERAAALYVTYRTGFVALSHRAALQPGETLLVHAGAGGVGSAAIQLGLALGARVFATAGGPEKAEVCRKLGAELVVDYLAGDFVEPVKEATGGRGADVIFDPVGGDVFDRSRRCIAFEGRILVIGFTGGRIADAPTNHALVKNYSIVGVNLGGYAAERPQFLASVHDRLDELVADGRIDPLVSEVVPFAQAPAALSRLGTRSTIGKIVCVPEEG